MKSDSTRRLLSPLFLALCLALLSGVVQAQNVPEAGGKDDAAKADEAKEKKEPVQMTASSPLALTQKPLAIQVRAARWFPVAVTLTNSGDPVQGTLSLRLLTAVDDNRTPTRFFTNVDLPTNSQKRIWLYGRVERQDTDKIEITFEGRGFRPKKIEGIIQAADASTRLIVTISDSDEKLSYLSGLRGPGLGLSPGVGTPGVPNAPNYGGPGAQKPTLNLNSAPVRPLGATHDFVPSRWIGLDAADLVVLQDFPHTALTPNQIMALRGYAAAGGSILVLGGANWQRLSTSPLSDLWPVVPQSSGTAAPSDVSTLINRFARFPNMTGADRLGGAPVVATRGTLKSGCRVLLGENNAPLLAVNDFGAGQVLFLAVDPTQPPFLGWRGLTRLWTDLFRPTTRPTQIASVGETRFEDEFGYRGGYYPEQAPSETPSGALLEALATSPQLRTPPVSLIAWFLALYVFFLVPVNYIVLRFLDRRELAWLTIPIIVIAFSLMSYVAALRIKGTAILTRQVNVVQGAASVNGAGSKWARADAMLWLFSPKKTSYDISSDDPQMALADYISDRNASVSIRQPEENQAFALDGAPINMWDWRSFVGHSVADLKGGVSLITRKNQIGIRNDSPIDLKGVVLVSHGRVLSYRTIKSKSTSFNGKPDAIAMNNAQLTGRVENASRLGDELPPTQIGGGFASMPNKLLSLALSGRWSTPSSFIVAWSEQPVAGLTIGRQSDKAQNLSLIVLRVENDSSLQPILARVGKSKGADASTRGAARVRLTGSEMLPLQAGKSAGAIYDYEAELPRKEAQRLNISLKVALENQYGNYGNQAMPVLSSAPVKAEIFNFERGIWQPLRLIDRNPKPKPTPTPKAPPPPPPGAAGKAPGSPVPGGPVPGGPVAKESAPPGAAPNNNWNLSTTISGPLARQCVLRPDGRAQLRFRTSNDNARISNLMVQAN